MRRLIYGVVIAAVCGWGQSFEAASIRPRADDRGVGLSVDGSRLTANNNSLANLIGYAYDLKPYQVIGVPGWGAEERYDLVAKAMDGITLTRASARPMMQALLSERFQVKTHRETREMPVYELVVLKGGPKFKESAPDAHSMLTMGGPRAYNVMKVTAGGMAQLASQFSNINGVDRPVLDKTGLAGLYDYTLRISAVGSTQQDLENPSVYTAMQDQLGLKLEPAKASIEVLVIDHAERPSEN